MSLEIRGGNELIDPVKLLEQGGIKQGDIVADLGCGSAGHFVFPAAHLIGPQGKVYAVDLLKSVLSAIESRAKLEGADNVETVWSDLERAGGLKIAERSVDLTLLLNTLAQVRDKQTTVREAARILKPGGTLLVADWKMSQTPLGPPVERRLDRERAKQIVGAEGFEFAGEFEAGKHHWGLIFKKR